MRKKLVLSVWRCETCHLSIVVQGHPRRQRHARCGHWTTFLREIRPAPKTR
jgi:hypothetical protein